MDGRIGLVWSGLVWLRFGLGLVLLVKVKSRFVAFWLAAGRYLRSW